MLQFQGHLPRTWTDSPLKDRFSAGKNRELGAPRARFEQSDFDEGRRKSKPFSGHGDARLSIRPADQLPCPTLLIVESGVFQAPDRADRLHPKVWQRWAALGPVGQTEAGSAPDGFNREDLDQVAAGTERVLGDDD